MVLHHPNHRCIIRYGICRCHWVVVIIGKMNLIGRLCTYLRLIRDSIEIVVIKMYAWASPFCSLLAVILLYVCVKIFKHAIKVHAWCAIEAFVFFELSIFGNILQYTSLWVEYFLLSSGDKRVIIETVVINIFFL